MPDPIQNIERIFAPEGPLADAVPGFRPRPQQVEMAQSIARAIADNGALVAEAGTGTGKTFAYLVPALLSGGKVIVSTGTKTLQDQLFNRDLPTVRDALGVGATIALLKGRANYVCPYHLERALSAARLATREEASHLRKIVRFAERTRTGDRAECIDVPEDSGAWAVATSTRENCLGQECPNAKGCFVTAARQEALMADVVVVNHHLFFADVMLKDEGMGELLPACNTIIFDEAHQLPEVAGLFFGESVSTTQIIELARDTRNEGIIAAKDYAPLQDAANALEKAARDLRLAVKGENLRLPAARIESEAAFVEALQGLAGAIAELGRHLDTQAERGEGLANCLRRTQELAAALKRWRGGSADPEVAGGDDVVKWVEVYLQAMSLNLTPLDIAPIFQRQMEGHPRAWIFTSATLAVGSNFSHYCGELGLTEAATAVWGSPFDYERNALLYAPTHMPDPNSPLYQEAVAEAAWPAIRASGGRAFVLCTSLRAMRRIRELLQEKLAAEGLDLPLLMQGEGSRTELLERFRFLGNAILVASQSFWEGVDVRGEALSLVVIDKLPFAPPDDPVLAARIDKLRAAGRNPFMEYQLPRAVINMKQGSGRLIRDEDDRGVLMICDPRLTGKPYGKAVWRSLPPMRRTRVLAEVEQFFAGTLPVDRRMNSVSSIDIAERLNADCHCVSLDSGRLEAELERVSPGFHAEVMAGRPHLFSSSVAFVGAEHVARMARLVAAVERVVAMPAYREYVLAWAAQSASHETPARGVFLGYDFHLGASGPQLIEINTNAGGGLLNALLARAQKACCDDVETLLPGDLGGDTPEHLFLEMFRAEWRAFADCKGNCAPLRSVAIVDESPREQYLYPEFVLFQRLFEHAGVRAVICDPQELEYRDGGLWYHELRIDLVYNRLTDFTLDAPLNGALRAAWLADAALITPHPQAHALYADKRNLVALCDEALLASWGVDAETRAILAAKIPRTELVRPELADDLWVRRKQLFFKPAAGYGSKAAYRGDKMTKRVFEEVLAGNYIAQALVPPSSRTLRVGEAPVELKLDLRNYVYAGHVQLIAARLWQGQTTNFRTPGGGFAPVLTVPTPEVAA